MPLSSRAPLLLAALLAAGCSAPVVDDVADANGGMTEAIVVVERATSSDGATQTNISAKFLHLASAADPDLAEHVVGVRLDVPAAGRCQELSPNNTENAASLATLGSIELFDVGDVTLRIKPTDREAAPAALPLATRAFPDVGDLVSGVFYTSRDTASEVFAGATYILEGTGNVDRSAGAPSERFAVERFSIEADAPAAPDDVRFGDAALTEGVSLEEGTATSVRWHAGDRTRDDRIFVDIHGASGTSVRCAFDDTGEAIVPARVLTAKLLVGAQATTVAFHRLRRRTFGTAGIDAGEMRFDLSVIGRATILPRTP